ncbi:hypothetical protein C4D60_Mb05t17780 [Musa balbisiana]|uniref:ARGOS-like protein n=1 Tax=Musa balbisiana TaxID=52838 RepID=A0A4S8JWX9_MUSBA|nr:hypothetical protein C4D60_Mb05t17780 [Musa balbisiana]
MQQQNLPRGSALHSRTPNDQIEVQAHWVGFMDARMRRNTFASGSSMEYKRTPMHHEPDRRTSPSTYFSIESFLLLAFVTASLLVLPLILPPLPPPPSMLLLLPIGLLVVLLILAFMPSDIRNIASSHLNEEEYSSLELMLGEF